MNRNQVKGRVREASGRLKQMTGKLFGNEWLQAKGGLKKAGGKVQTSYGDATDSARKRS